MLSGSRASPPRCGARSAGAGLRAGDAQQDSRLRDRHPRHRAVRPYHLQVVQVAGNRVTEAEVDPRRVAGQVAAAGSHFAQQGAGGGVQAQHRAHGTAVGHAFLAQLHLEGAAAAQPVLEQQRGRRQVVHHHVQVAVVVQVAEAHAAPALGGVQAPLRRRHEASIAGVAQRLVLLHQLVAGQVGEDLGGDHAVDHVQVEVAVVVEVAELRRPAPSRGVHPDRLGHVDERFRGVRGGARVQHVGGDLDAVVGLQVGGLGPQRSPGGVGVLVALVRLHVGGQQLVATVVVDVALGEAHGVDGGAREGRRLGPAGGRVEVDQVGGREVVADQDVAPPVAVEVTQVDRQGVGAPSQPLELQQAGAVVAVEEHSAAHHQAVPERAQFGIVGGAHQVQVAVGVEIGPGDGVGRKPGLEPLVFHALEAGAAAGRVRLGAPPGGQAAGVGEHQVEQAVAVDVHGVDGARQRHRQIGAAEEQVALVPDQGGGIVQAGQDDVDAAVVVQVGQRHPGAVALEEADELVGSAGVVGQRLHVEAAGAFPRVGGQRPAAHRDGDVGGKHRRHSAEGAQPGRHQEQAQSPRRARRRRRQ